MGDSSVLGPLPEAESLQTLEQVIIPAFTRGAVSQSHPVVVVIAGRPGPGKTQIADLVQAALDRRGGAVRICSDLYKPGHSRYAKLLTDDVRTAGVKVRPDTRELDIAGLASLTPAIELADAFHQAVLNDHTALHATHPATRTDFRRRSRLLRRHRPLHGRPAPRAGFRSPVARRRTAHPQPLARPGHRPTGAPARQALTNGGPFPAGKWPPVRPRRRGSGGVQRSDAVPAYSSGSSDRTVSCSPAFTACQAIAAAWATHPAAPCRPGSTSRLLVLGLAEHG